MVPLKGTVGAVAPSSLPTEGTDPPPQPAANLKSCYHRYVLLHHVMGELEGRRGAWGYVAGGMGALSQAIAQAATARGAHIFAEKVWGVWERGAAWHPCPCRQQGCSW